MSIAYTIITTADDVVYSILSFMAGLCDGIGMSRLAGFFYHTMPPFKV